MLDKSYLDAIKNFEGYAPEARWDYAQNTNGYGTRARFAGEVIDKAEADKRFADEIKKAADFVDKFAPGLDDGSKAALTSLTYNSGTAWTANGLGKAVASGDLDTARAIFLQYNKAGGSTLDGLVQRRLQEVTWFGQGAGAATQMADAASPVAASSGAPDTATSSGANAPLFSTFSDAAAVMSAARDGASSAGSGTSFFSGLGSDPVLLSLLTEISKSARASADDKEQRQTTVPQTPTV